MATIELTHDQLDQIVVDRLKDAFLTLVEAIRVLNSRDSLMSHEVKDLTAHKKDLQATRRVLQYFMIKSEFEEFLKDNIVR